MTPNELRAEVFRALDSAKEQGYWNTGTDPMLFWSDEQIALDIIAYDDDLSEYVLSDLLDHVQAWRKGQEK